MNVDESQVEIRAGGTPHPKLRCLRVQKFAVPVRTAVSNLPDQYPTVASYCPAFHKGSGLGWLVYPPFDARVVWHGRSQFSVEVSDTLLPRIWSEVMEELIGWPSSWWCSKIEGVLQIDPGLAFVTPRGTKLLVTNPVNRFYSAYTTQSGVLDSDWFWVPSTINLEIRQLETPFEIRREEPIAQLIPLNDHLCSVEDSKELDFSKVPVARKMWLEHLNFAYGKFDANERRVERKRYGAYERLKGIPEYRWPEIEW